ncbi:MAG: S16 family serine protease [Candidatus Diapherotrites archaeon]|nr:S16 family serine protease [Candidatus Diapherotrites archaeon]
MSISPVRPLAFLLCLLLLASPALAVLSQSTLKIFAVTDDGKGLSADLTLYTEAGTGKVWSSVNPLVGTSTQNAERMALALAKKYSDKTNQFDYKFQITSNASIVDGPSAGAATSLLLISALTDRVIPKEVGLTGTISSDGSVGAVGGVFEKAQEASRIGIKLFMVPRGEAKQVVKLPNGVQSVNLAEYAPANWGMKVVEISDIDQVISYAYSDISKIDVNQQIKQTQDNFIPRSIAYSPQTAPLATITKKYVDESKRLVNDAKTALNTTTLTDRSLIDIMLDSMNESERVIERAGQLFDQNFLYSSANFSFLAKINALLIKDIAQNPSLLNDTSVAFHSRIKELQSEIEQIKPSIDSGLISENLDWQISAQERLAWAQNNADQLENTQTIVIPTDIQSGTDYNPQLERLRDYEFAVSWKDVASDLSRDLGQGRKLSTDHKTLDDYIQKNLADTENRLNMLKGEDVSDIQRRFESAQAEQKNGWVLAAATDAVGASYLAQADLWSKDKNLSELKTELETKVKQLDANLSLSPQPFSWARIYLDHARYFLQGVNYYIDKNDNASATDMAKSGVAIAYLAQASFESSVQLYAYYDSLPPTLYDFQPAPLPQTTDTPFANNASPPNPLQNYLLVVAIIAIVISWIIIFMLWWQKRSQTVPLSGNLNYTKELATIDSRLSDLDKKLASGKISQNEYGRQKSDLLSKKHDDEQQARETSRETLETDELRARVRALESEITMIRKDYKKGLILKTDYVETVESTRNQLKKTETQLKAKKKTTTKK